MINFRINYNHLLSLFFLGSLVCFREQTEGRPHQYFLRRKAYELCTPFVPQLSLEESFTFVVLEFEKNNLTDEYVPYVNGTLFEDTYNELTNCDQFGAIRGIHNVSEFSPKALPLLVSNDSPMEHPKVLIEVQSFYCNACGDRDLKLFYDESDPIGADIIQDPNVCDCRGPTSEAFVTALITNLGLTNLKNATQIHLLHPDECNAFALTFFSNAGVCPGRSNPEFDFFTPYPTSEPTESPTTESPTSVPTDVPTDLPTEIPTDVPTDFPTDHPTELPTDGPTSFPSLSPTSSPTGVRATKAPVMVGVPPSVGGLYRTRL